MTVGIDGVNQSPKGARPATLLALLAANVNRRVAVDTIVDAVWGERITEGRTSTLESHVWRLRRILEPHRQRGQPPEVLVNDAGGYRLLVDPDRIDSVVFEQLADEGREALATGRPTGHYAGSTPRWRCGADDRSAQAATNPGPKREWPAARSCARRSWNGGLTPYSRSATLTEQSSISAR